MAASGLNSVQVLAFQEYLLSGGTSGDDFTFLDSIRSEVALETGALQGQINMIKQDTEVMKDELLSINILLGG